MPDISKIKLVLDQEEETFDVKDSEARNILDVLLGKEENEDYQGE